jgi:hypothetical protein
MTRWIWISPVVAAVTTLVVATSSTPSRAASACARSKFETELVKRACTSGGQEAAKEAMKAFNKQNKIKSCNQCHTKLAPTYALKPDAVEQFRKLGGK